MPPVLPDPRTAAREAARAVVWAKLPSLFRAERGQHFADEIADAVLDAVQPLVRGAALREAAEVADRLRDRVVGVVGISAVIRELDRLAHTAAPRLRDLPPGEFGDLVRKITPTSQES